MVYGGKGWYTANVLPLISLIIWAISEVFSQALNRNQLTAKHKTKGARKYMLFKQVCCAGSPRVSNNNYKFCHKPEANWIFPEKWTWACDPLKTITDQPRTLRKHITSTSCTPEPTIRSCDTGHRISYFDSCQLTTTWVSNTKFNTACLQLFRERLS